MDNTAEISIVAHRQYEGSFAEKIKVNKVYELKNFTVQEDSKIYPSGTGHELKIILSSSSILSELAITDIAPIPFNFLKLQEILALPTDSKADFVAIVVKDEGITRGKNWVRRHIFVADSKKNEALWGLTAENFSTIKRPVVFRKSVVSDFCGEKTIKSANDTLVLEDPELEEAQELMEWFEKADADNSMDEDEQIDPVEEYSDLMDL